MAGRDLSAELFGDVSAGGRDLSAELFGNQPDVKAKKSFKELLNDSFAPTRNYDATDAMAGLARGLGSVGATLLSPIDYAARSLNNGQPVNIGGYDIAGQDRRSQMDAALQNLGANTDSTQFKTSKLLAEAGATFPIGGMAAKGLEAIPGAANQIPRLIDAIRTGGMSVGGATGAYGAATRVAGGAVNGALTAGAIDPKDADTGAMIGGAFPVAVKAAGNVGGWLGNTFGSKNTLNPTKLQTAKESIDAGYVIPPSMIDPSLIYRTLESMGGKIATAQTASNKNQSFTESLARRALGLPSDAPLTFETMKAYRAAQHQTGYEPLRQVGNIQVGPEFNQALDAIANQYTGKGTIPAIAAGKKEITDLVNSHKTAGFDAGDAVDAIRTLREDATALFRSTTASDKAKAKATKAIADAYEGAIDDALKNSGKSDLLAAYREARRNIAQSGTVEKAIREGSGTLDARILGRELQKNKPLSGDLLTIAKFANTFDKAAQPPHLIGSPAVNNLTAMFSTGTGAAGGATGAALGGPAGAAFGAAAGAAYPYVVPPLLRARMFSNGAQQNLLKTGGRGLLGSSVDELLPLMYKSNPALIGGLIDQ